MVQMSKGQVPQSNSVAEMIAYVSFQELATQVAHRNTGQALDKTMRGKKIMSKVAGDEGLHHAFYRDLVLAALEIDPSTMVMAIQSELRTFKMPGTGIPEFAKHEEAIALAGIFGAQQFVDAVVKPTDRLLAGVRARGPERRSRPGTREDGQEPCRAHTAGGGSTGTNRRLAGLSGGKPKGRTTSRRQLAIRSPSSTGSDIVATPTAESPMP